VNLAFKIDSKESTYAATAAFRVSGSETGRSSAVAVSDTAGSDRMTADAALRHESDRIAAMSILPSIRKGSFLSPDSVRTGMEPAILMW
jgi:hypothetical protein